MMSETPLGKVVSEPEPAELEAIRWHERMSSPNVSAENEAAFERWVDISAAHAAHYKAVERTWRLARDSADAPQILTLRHETLSRLTLFRRRSERPVALAAAITACVVVSAVLYSTRSSDDTNKFTAVTADYAHVYQTGVGERLTVALADGSEAELNTDTRLHTAYDINDRRLVLERGEALFKVAKGQRRPFDVVAGDRTITAHGTEFDVHLASDALRVALMEGRISVAKQAAGEKTMPIKLVPRDILIAESNATLVLKNQDLEQIGSWRSGMVIFKNERLADAVREMNRYIKRPSLVVQPSIGGLRISGAFRTGEIGAFVDALQQTFPIEVRGRTSDTIVLGARQ
jgi:transmembrane sensor